MKCHCPSKSPSQNYRIKAKTVSSFPVTNTTLLITVLCCRHYHHSYYSQLLISKPHFIPFTYIPRCLFSLPQLRQCHCPSQSLAQNHRIRSIQSFLVTSTIFFTITECYVTVAHCTVTYSFSSLRPFNFLSHIFAWFMFLSLLIMPLLSHILVTRQAHQPTHIHGCKEYTKKSVTTMLTYPWKCTVLHCNHLGDTWKPLVLMTRHFDYCPSASERDNQSVRSSAPVVSRCLPGGYNVKLYISRGRLAWWLLAFLAQ